MFSIALFVAFLATSITAAPNKAASKVFDLSRFAPANIIQRDVAVIGGGSSGTHAAISLKDQGHSVIVIEKKGRLGGHTETYIDPGTGIPIDYGVVVFHNHAVVKDHFARLNVSLSTMGAFPSNIANFDLKTGTAVNVTQYTQEEVGAALAKYAQIIAQWPQLDGGMFLPEPVPEDLILPFGDFAKKHDIEAVIPTFYNYNAGLGDFLTIPTVENIRIVGLSLVQALQSGFLTTTNHVNSELYLKATTELLNGGDLLLNSEVIHSHRSDSRVALVVQTSTGTKLILAKKLLISAPPKVDLLRPFNLCPEETAVFSKFVNTGYYTSIVNNTGIPDNQSVFNFAENTPFNIPELSGVYSIQLTGVPGLKTVYYGTPRTSATQPLSDDTVKHNIVADIKKLQAQNPTAFQSSQPEFVEFSSHTPFYLQASAEDTKNGFYKSLYALQGLKSTFWTGAAWKAQDSSSLWKFNKQVVLPQLVQDL